MNMADSRLFQGKGKAKRVGLMTAVLLLGLSACSSAEQDAASTGATAVASTATPPPARTSSPEPAAPSPQDDQESMFHTMLLFGGDAYGSATDEQLLAAGRKACEAFDVGASLELAAAMTVLELPEDVTNEGHSYIAITAAMYLCPEHEAIVS
ncbi:MAG: DUF732 domain-containing protein [Actinobacteria bacterium]|nr:DUF732 domain-containing protein [Actinomycetota bacterium]